MFVKRHPLALLVFLAAFLTPALLTVAMVEPAGKKQSKKDKETLLDEESEDYYKKWLKEDVVYIITPEEKSVFEKLSNPEEKEQFIEQFWYRRDPDERTMSNAFKEEHYRRIAYANERFYSGKPGWQTDRGRIYIIHGPPDQLESFASGSTYARPMQEGGGYTKTYPWERWRYRYIEGLGPEVILEFVDKSMTGEFRLSFVPEDKDALLMVPGAGLTFFEEMTGASKTSRPYFTGRREYPYTRGFHNDRPFERYYRYTRVQRPTEIKYKDLKEIVNINITYETLPIKMSTDYIRLNEDQVLVPITLEIRNKDLTFKEEAGVHLARVSVYGIITSITHRIITEFEDDMMASFKPEFLERGLGGRSLYQKIVPVDRKMRYKLDFVVKDVHSGHVGVIRRAIIPPSYDEKKLSLSSLILSDHIVPLEITPTDNEMFVLGDVKIRPSLSKIFPANSVLGVYLQVYNAGIDQTTLTPSLQVTYRVLQGDQVLLERVDESGEAIQFVSGQRVVLIKQLPLQSFSPGRYRVQIEIRDQIKDQQTSVSDQFQVKPPLQVAQNR